MSGDFFFYSEMSLINLSRGSLIIYQVTIRLSAEVRNGINKEILLSNEAKRLWLNPQNNVFT